MKQIRHSPEQIIYKLREADAMFARSSIRGRTLVGYSVSVTDRLRRQGNALR
jgi:hypothetical protein